MHTKKHFVFAMLLAALILAAPTAMAANIVMISGGGRTTAAPGDDQPQFDRMSITLGHTVEIVEIANVGTVDLSTYDLVFISESIGGGDGVTLDPLIEPLQKPVILGEPGALGTMGWAVGGGGYVGANNAAIEIVNPSDPYAAGFPAGNVTVYNNAAITVDADSPSAEAVVVAVQPAGAGTAGDRVGLPCLWYYPTGANMVSGVAAERRIFIWADREGFASMGDNGWTLFDNLITLALAPETTPGPGPTVEVGMVVSDSTNLAGFGFDAALFDYLTTNGLGYNVELVNGSNFNQAVADQWATSKALVVISESISSSNADEWAGKGVPTLTFEGFGWDNLGYGAASTGGVWIYNGTQIGITDATHPVISGAGVSTGLLTVHTVATQIMTKAISELAAGVQVLATAPPGSVDLDGGGTTTGEGADYASIWALELGDPIVGGQAPARNVGMFLEGANDAIRTADQLTTDGYNLIGSAITWLLADPNPNKVEKDRWMLY